ncbi:MAG TPA: hypothetical protein VGX91_10460 [Candidatus Cybelea sp.]|jgi:hypothetical protein|nr:hypothetical protein [Candidatus Cybelea sp.]
MKRQAGDTNFEGEEGAAEIRDDSNRPEIMDDELDRVSGGGGNNSVWGTKQRGGYGAS